MTELHDLWAEHDRVYRALIDLPAEERRAQFTEAETPRIRALRRHLGDLTTRIGVMQRDFTDDLRAAFRPQVKTDRQLAVEIYCAMCNVAWRHEDGSRFSCSWRTAGGIVADLRNLGEDYLHFYCSGLSDDEPPVSEGDVTDRVAAALAERGWAYEAL